MRKDVTPGPLDSHRYIENIVISKIVISGFFPIHFTVTFAEYSIFTIMPEWLLYKGSLYQGSTVETVATDYKKLPSCQVVVN